MNRILLFVVAFSLTIFVPSCAKKSLEEFLSDYSLYEGYIEMFSSGYVSRHNPITIELAQDLPKRIMEIGPSKKWFDISPAVQGEVLITNANTIQFVPNEPLDANTEYRISFHLNKVLDVPKDLHVFNFAIQTLEQNFTINIQDIQSYDRDWQYLRGSVQFADLIDFETAKQLVSAEQEGRELTVKFDKENDLSCTFTFVIDSVQRKIEDSKVKIRWNGKKAKIDNKDEADFDIPGKNNFKVVSMDIENGEQQKVKINFSDPLLKNQNLKGLVRIEDAEDLKFTYEGNVLNVYLPEVMVGTKAVFVAQGIKSVDDLKMKKDYREQLLFEELKPEVRFVRSGIFLPSSQNLKINFEAVNLSAVDIMVYRVHSQNILQFLQINDYQDNEGVKRVGSPVAKTTIQLNHTTSKSHTRWNAYAIDLSKIMQPDPGAIYRVQLSIRPEYSMLDCNEALESYDQETKPFKASDYDLRSGWDYWDDDDYYYYDYHERENPCHSAYYYSKRVSTNIMATDLGVIAKRGEDGAYLFAVSDLNTTKPVAGATIEMYTFDQQMVHSLKTNSDGIAEITTDRYAFFAKVKKDKHVTPIKLAENISNSLSAFDVSGERLSQGMNGYIYGERGVWRPGDTLFLGFILNDKQASIEKRNPVKLTVYNARGIEVHQEIAPFSALNHYQFMVPTSPDAETGYWEANIQVGGANFRKSLFVETVKPNRLKLKTEFDNKILSSKKGNKAKMQVNWLHGATAKDLKVDISVKYQAMKTVFKGYETFTFDDPARDFYAEEAKIFEGRLNDKGQVDFELRPETEDEAPGMLRAVFMARAFEKGGDFSSDVFSATVSPYGTYVGFRPINKNKYDFIETGSKSQYEVVTLDAYGKPKPVKDLLVRVYKIDYSWWYDASADYLSRYTSSTSHIPFKTMRINTDSKGKGKFGFEVDNNEWGRYLVRIYDGESKHATGGILYYDWPINSSYRRSRSNESDEATKLVFLTDKKSYNVGENMKVTFPSAANGRAFLSIENSTKVVKHQWVNTNKGETEVSIPITADMTPNVFVHITMLQPHANTVNDAPIRLYGIQPIEVIDKETILKPTINMPSSLKPEENFTVEVGEQNGKSMSYTIAVVDEGLLDLTRFKTPDAWNTFYARQALGVRTWDIFDHVIGAFGGKISQIFSIGGDEDLEKGNPKKPNRFVPVVRVLGPFELKPGQKMKHHIQMPNYVGSVRTMVIASDTKNFAYGSTEKTTPVKTPLMLLASAPRQVSPGELVTLPITVFAMEKHVKNVSLKIQTSNNIKVKSSSSQSINFASPDDKVTYFDLEIGNNQGPAKITVTATSGGEKASYEVDLYISNPNPPSFEVHDLMIEPNANGDLDFSTFGIQGSNYAVLELSVLPPMNIEKRLGYLIAYPHGCLEQVTSAVFPQLYLTDLVDLSSSKKAEIQKNINTAIKKLQNYQVSNGGFAYWPGSSSISDWSTSYVGHFLIEAERLGYQMPIGFKKKWIQYQKNAAKQWNPNLQYENDLSQAYRLYTLALAGEADVAAMNRLKAISDISSNAKLRLAAAYAKIGQKSAALELVKSSNFEQLQPRSNYYFDSHERNYAMALETLVELGEKAKARNLTEKVSGFLSDKAWMSTQSTAFSLLAMGKYAHLVGGKNFSATYTINGKTEKIKGSKPVSQEKLKVALGSNSIKVRNSSQSTLFARIVVHGILPIGAEKTNQNGLNLAVSYRDASGSTMQMAKLDQGTDVLAVIRISNGTNTNVNNVALSHIVPSGFEIVNMRFTEYGSDASDAVDYRDIRDDRSNFYFSLNGGETKTFTVRLSSSFPGRYYLPGAQAEAMYDNNYSSRTLGQWIEILKE